MFYGLGKTTRAITTARISYSSSCKAHGNVIQHAVYRLSGLPKSTESTSTTILETSADTEVYTVAYFQINVIRLHRLITTHIYVWNGKC